jgi:hypothetical protein
MPGSGYIKQIMADQKVKHYDHSITVGEVADTNDPQQQGRLRVFCPAFGDADSMLTSSIPWSIYGSPFAGSNEFGARGVGEQQTEGPVAYGMFNIPKVGTQVLVACVDGNPANRVWFAALYKPWSAHTLPHGRYITNGAGEGKPEGPLSSSEQPINPLYDNQTEAFGGGSAPARQSFEWITRGSDGQAAFLKNEYIRSKGGSDVSEVADDRNAQITEADGDTITRNAGYGKSRIEPYLEDQITDGVNWDPQNYSWTTPGFHSIAMTDRKDNCRMRFRTTGGSQIILDDTNERIYISTAKGKSWIEIDEQGPIYIYTEQDFSVRAKGDINFTTDKTFRVSAAQGIHLNSSGDIRATTATNLHLHAASEVHVQAGSTLHLLSSSNTFIESGANLNMLATSNAYLEATSDLNLKSGANWNGQAGATLSLTGGSQILETAPQIHLNGPTATPAATASPAVDAENAFISSMIPNQEPFARSYTASDTSASPEYDYNSPEVGRGSAVHGITLTRNPEWHR